MNGEGLTISKVKNIIIMLLTSISEDNIKLVDHFLDDDLVTKFEKIVESNIKKKVKQNFGMLNISQVAKCSESANEIQFNAKVRYADFKTDRKKGNIIEGDPFKVATRNVVLVFKKNAVDARMHYSCPSCGAGLNINATSICPYCAQPVDERYSPFVLTKIIY